MRTSLTCLILFLSNILAFGQITAPSEFLGYELGSQFTRHHQVVDYFQLLEKESEGRMKIVPYGKTNEGRPLFTAIITSEENMSRLEEIRVNNLKHTGLEEGDAENLGVAIVWLSYNVHGDEAVSTEAALKTVHKFLDKSDAGSVEWLKKAVIIMDPCINPDGRARYVQFYGQFRQNPANARPEAFSHDQGWPSGRSNHYFFDLNRDWVWLSQIESKQRLKLYQQWMPHIHVDFHEQGINSPYYFAPGAEPYHAVITDWQREFQVQIGKNHAKYFDQNYWSYFSAEVFDLLYPSYGDTYPTFNGAIGMTYEQGGSGEAGTAVLTEYGDTLTLADRIEHHYTTGFSTVEIAAMNSEKLESEFATYFTSEVPGPYKSYLISASNDKAKVNKLVTLLEAHNIRFGLANSNKKASGRAFGSNADTDVTPNNGDLIIPVNQPKGRLVTALFEPETFVFDSLTYDLTAWNLPLAYGLTGAALTTTPANDASGLTPPPPPKAVSGTDYGYLLSYTSLNSGKALGKLLTSGVQVGVADDSFESNGTSFPAGTVVILKGNNRNLDLGKVLSDIQQECAVNFIPVSTGFTARGIDLGSNRVRRLEKKQIGLLAGEGTSSYNVGELWHFFEQELDYPVTMLKASSINYIDLSAYDIIIIPEGGYSGLSGQMDRIKNWASDGGKIVVFGRATRLFADEEGSSITLRSDDEESEAEDEFASVGTFGQRAREYATRSIPGAIFEVNIDNTHPLGYGYGNSYHTLKTSSFGPVRLTSGQVVGQLPDVVTPVNGFAGKEAVENLGGTVVIGKTSWGRGSVTLFVDNPVFRSFWENGKLFVVNALLMDY